MLAIIALLIEISLLAIIKSNGTMEISNVGATLLILLFTLCFVVSINRNKKLNKLYSQPLCAGYLLRIAILYFDIFGQSIYTLPNTVGDATVFYRNARIRAQEISYGITTFSATRGFYPNMMGRLFSVIGTNRLYGQFLSMLCSIVALIFFAYTLSQIDISEATKKSTFRIVCLLPNFAILSSAFLREAIVCMFISISLYCFMLWIQSKRNIFYLVAAALVLPAARFHSGTIAVLIGYIAILLIYDNKSRSLKVKVSNILLTGVLLIGAVMFLSSTADQFLGKFGSLDSLDDIANTTNFGRTSYARYVGNSNNPLNVILFTIPRLFFFLLSPLPWMWSSIGDIIAFFFSSLYYLVVIIKVFQYLKHKNAKNRPLIIALLVIAFGVTFVFSWGCSNAGTAARHRDKTVILYGLLLALSTGYMPKKG